jgi:hypothetical protein
MSWFMEQLHKGFFEVVNPFNQRVSIVPATADRVHTLVFWSKNFGPFIDKGYGPQLQKRGYHLFFNFTINSDNPVRDNLKDFAVIADYAATSGISRCITSFMDHYPKIRRRLASRPGFEFIDPPLSEKINTILEMETRLAALNIRLYTCCEKDFIQALPGTSSVTPSSCIPSDLLMDIYGGHLSLRRDTGQRVKAGCGCKVSADIGSYRQQPCYHNCLFCYANPTSSSY